MSDSRVVILGMNNPHSERPDSALLPWPRGVAGYRLWSMVHDVCGVSRAEYCRLTDRRNLLDARTWCHRAATERLQDVGTMLQGRRVIVLGRTLAHLMWLPSTTPASWVANSRFGCTVAYIPHPSGLCRDYNDPIIRVAAGLLVEEELCRVREAARETAR